MRQKGALYGVLCVAALLGIISTRGIPANPEVRFFLLRLLSIRSLPDPARGILTTYPPFPLLLALAFREYFPLVTGWGTAWALLLVGVKRGNLHSALLVLLSPTFLFGTLMRPALTLFSLFAALGFSAILQSTTEESLERLLLGNLAFGFGACLHPLGLWLSPVFASCEACSLRVPMYRRGTLAALALFPFLVFQSITPFFGWVYEGYAWISFQDPGFSLEAFLRGESMTPCAQNFLLALPFLFAALFSGPLRALIFWGIFVLSLPAPHLTVPFASLPLAFLLALDPEPRKGTPFWILAGNVLGWVLVLYGFFPC
jgi:hypothetical protein